MGQVEVRLGRAGSGKSTRIAQTIAAELRQAPFGPRIFWIVPSDASYATERLLLEHVPASVRAEVLNLQRLAQRAHQETGQGEQPILQTGRRLLLASIYQRRAGDLRVLHRTAPSLDFLDGILNVFGEFSHHLVSLDQVEAMLETAAAAVLETSPRRVVSASQRLLGKLRELCLLYADYARALSERDLYDPDQLLALTQPRLSDYPDLAGATLYVDGFFDLLPDEREFLLAAARVADRTVLTFPVHPDALQSHAITADGVFAPQALRACHEWLARCAEVGVSATVVPERRQPGEARFGRAPDLARVEALLFAQGPARGGKAPHVHLAAAQNPRAEADGAAEAVARLVRQEGLSYGDIAILVPQLADYAPLLADSLARREVPAYIDVFPSFATHPLATLVLAAIDAVESKLAQPALIRLLKCDLCGLARDEADWLETYLRTYEIEGQAALADDKPWTYASAATDGGPGSETAQRDDERGDELRRKLADVMLPLFADVGGAECTPTALAEALWALLGRVQAKRSAATWMVNESAAEQPAEASLHEQAWVRLLAVLNDLAQTDSGEALQRSFLFRLVRDDIVGQSLSSIPAGVDEVLVTQVTHASAWEAKAVLILGALDGALPRRIRPTGLLQDDEREQFAHLFGVRIADTSAQRQLAERSVVYGALTRATEQLYLSYPLAGMDGKAAQPSLLIAQLRTLFDDDAISEQLWLHDTLHRAGADIPDVTALTPAIALMWIAAALRDVKSAGTLRTHAVYDAILDWFEQDDVRKQTLERALRGVQHKTAAQPLGAQLARFIYPDPLVVNVHQLEAYASCHYRHFATHALHLAERPQVGISPALRGNLLHDTLLRFVEDNRVDMARWRDMTDEEAVAAMQRAFTAVLAAPGAAPWRRSALRSARAAEAASVLDVAAVVLTRHARRGLFAPMAMELSFGLAANDRLPALEIEVEPGVTVLLRGRIDRVDVAEIDGEFAFRIVDYKSSQKKLDWNQIEQGLQLQLPVYATVVEERADALFGRSAVPAAMLYIPLRQKPETKDVPDTLEGAREEAVKGMRANGLVVDKPEFVKAMDDKLATGGSELFGQVYKKDGGLAKSAPALSETEWRAMQHRVWQHVRGQAARMLSGDIAVAPFQLDSQTACDYCAFSAMCQIDPRWDRAPFRRLQKRNRDDLTAAWTQAYLAANETQREEA
ncbi:PD-(D/E)XK nuclease family protein [Alicyclobacillus sp. ALC3]|uniref:PD-(D/E)XK nuclease family protein n=1 Tax=Alicyclobacillus sp. ALC3 TaxID=2796143 RepID=UPI0023780740|nr:PD-(D/E)XK nuclease family protein [Alicyclobacillus sp. ALC3]WDL96215.1 PD-(D/E)XK nuclease family protein [Alicyclobacillus sp. ALC3]